MRGDNKIPATVTTPLPREGQGSGVAYQKSIDYLFNVAPMFQNIGAGAYKEGLQNTHALDEHFGHPHHSFKTIHVGGTNGKGSVSHTLAAILQSAGYKVGLYTSPHLVDFRERIRVNGEMIPEQRVIDFVEQERSFFEPLYPSFFELATALAFKYFEEQQVDIAVIDMMSLDTRLHKNLLGTFISDVFLYVLSFVAENERMNIRQRQREGIEAARLKGVHLGRPARSLPRNFEHIAGLWLAHEISGKEGAAICGLPLSTFYRKCKEMQKNQPPQK